MLEQIAKLLLGESRDEARISFIAALALTLVGLCSGLAVFAIFAHEMKGEAQSSLARSLTERERFFSTQLQDAIGMASDVVQKRPRLRKLLGFAATRALTPDEHDEIKLILNNILSTESGAVQAISLKDGQGNEIAAQGKFSPSSGLSSQIILPFRATLFWRNGYFIHLQARFVEQQKHLGEMSLEIALSKLTDLAMRDQELALSAETNICMHQRQNQIQCFPNSRHAKGTRLEIQNHGLAGMLEKTLDGNSEVAWLQDENRSEIIAVTKPVGNTGLAMMITMSADELGSNARQKLLVVLPLMGVLVLFGVLLLRWRLGPLVHEVVSSRAKVKAVIDSSAVGIITSQGSIIDSANPTAGKIFGYPPEDLLGRDIYALIPDLPLKSLGNSVREFSGNQEKEATAICSDGTQLPVSLACSRMEIERQVVDIVMMQDISARREAEEQLRRKNEELNSLNIALEDTRDQLVLSEKMASLGALVAGISHEINTPIGISVTSTSALDEQIRALQGLYENGSMTRSDLEQFVGRARQATDILQRNLQRASDLIRSFKQVAVDQSSADWRNINLHEYCDEILLSLAPKLKHRAIRVDNDCDPALSLYTQPGAIYQIISNLILNSLIHAFEADMSGEIRIQARQVNDKIELDYSDNGKGVAAEHLNRIFDPFFTTRRGQGGSGLGLSIVYNLITGTLKGRVAVASAPNQGISFHITLPTQKAAETKA